jgi:hypothetical protein
MKVVLKHFAAQRCSVKVLISVVQLFEL